MSDYPEEVSFLGCALKRSSESGLPARYRVFRDGVLIGYLGRDERPTSWYYQAVWEKGGFTPGAESLADAVRRLVKWYEQKLEEVAGTFSP